MVVFVVLELTLVLYGTCQWWRTRYFGGELSYFAQHGLVRRSEEYKISP